MGEWNLKFHFRFKLLLFFWGCFLLVKSCKMSPKTVQKVCSVYNGGIFGSLAGFILIENIFVMIAGALILSVGFVAVDRYFKNDGMFSVAFICIFNCIYMMVIGILYYVSDILYSRVKTAEEISWVCEYFDPVSQEENVFLCCNNNSSCTSCYYRKKSQKNRCTAIYDYFIWSTFNYR